MVAKVTSADTDAAGSEAEPQIVWQALLTHTKMETAMKMLLCHIDSLPVLGLTVTDASLHLSDIASKVGFMQPIMATDS